MRQTQLPVEYREDLTRDDFVSESAFANIRRLEERLEDRFTDLYHLMRKYGKELDGFYDYRPTQRNIVNIQRITETLLNAVDMHANDGLHSQLGYYRAKYDILQSSILGLELLREERDQKFVKTVDLRAYDPKDKPFHREVAAATAEIEVPEYDGTAYA